jgi:type IV secretion system protein VirB10
MIIQGDGDDPRREPGSESLSWRDDSLPLVANTSARNNGILILVGFAVLAVALFLILNGQRLERARLAQAAKARPPVVAAAPPQFDPVPRPVNPTLFPATPPPAPYVPTPIVMPPAPGTSPADILQRRRAPSVVVDLQPAGGGFLAVGADAPAVVRPANPTLPVNPTLPPGAAAQAAAAAATAAGAARNPNQAALDQMAQSADAAPETAVASQLNNLGAMITQGTMIPGVLETALNSDLPGFARAIVSRDVRSFDGRAVLIPRGSRLIGQYRSAISLGQQRVFVIWTRVIRPDGVSVQIGSPGADALGRGGLQGEIDRHFFSRFGGSIVLSVLNAGVAAVSRTPSTQITIGSPAAAAAAAGSASFGQGEVNPTIKIAQGEAIRIFIARDLDFSGVKPVQ